MNAPWERLLVGGQLSGMFAVEFVEFIVVHVLIIFLVLAYVGDVPWPDSVTIGGIAAAVSVNKAQFALVAILVVVLLIYRRVNVASKRVKNIATANMLLIRYFDITMSDELRDRPAPSSMLGAVTDFLASVFCWHGDMPMHPTRGGEADSVYRCINVAARLTDDLRRVLQPECPLAGQYVDCNDVLKGPHNKFIAEVCPEQPLADQRVFVVMLAVRTPDISKFMESRMTLVRREAPGESWVEVDDTSKYPEAESILQTWRSQLKSRL